MKSRNIAYIPAVDHIRAFASVLIVVYHSYQLISQKLRYGGAFSLERWIEAGSWLEAVVVEGHTAVAIFLVLSGFLFTHGALGKDLAYGTFLRNRLLRIYPLFLFLLVVGIGAFPEAFHLVPFLQSVLGFANLQGAVQLDAVSGMFWTVGIEFQFYLVFPFLLGFADRGGARPLLLLILATIVFRSIGFALGGDVHGLTYWTLVGRVDQFLFGMLAALFFRSRYCRETPMALGLIPVTVAMVGLLAAFNAAGGWPAKAAWKMLWPTVEGFGWAVFLLCYLCAARHIPPRVSRAIAAVGVISYSTYLIHYMVIRVAVSNGWILGIAGGSPESAGLLTGFGLILPLVLVIATLSYHAIERPFLDLRRTYLR